MEPAVVRAIQERHGLFAQDHHPDLPVRQREVLLLEYFGFEADEMANTSTRTMYVNYVDYYGGGTSPNPPESSASNYVWGPDSWEFGNNSGQSYRFGALSGFNQHSFYSYDITLWVQRSFNYTAGYAVTTMAQFGASNGSGGVEQYCSDYSYLSLFPY